MFQCSWKETFGIECPGCGAQRSFVELIHGNISESIHLFPALIPLLATIILAGLIVFKVVRANPIWIARLFGLTAAIMFTTWVVKQCLITDL